MTMTLAILYPDDFNSGELRDLSHQFCLYIVDVRTYARFSNLHIIGDLSQKMVETRKNIMWYCMLSHQLVKGAFLG
jgi:rhodanese-related sulfurtransferase